MPRLSVSLRTPTTSNVSTWLLKGGWVSRGMRTIWPMAARPSSRVRTNAWFTTASGRRRSTSVSVKRRPSTSGNAEHPRVIGAHLMNLGAGSGLADAGHLDGRRQIPERMHSGIQADGLDAGDFRHAREQILEKRDAPLGVGIARLRQRHTQRQHAIGPEAEIDVLHRQDGPNHQTGRDEQHQRQRDFGDHERLAKEHLPAAAGHAAARLAERGGDVLRRRVERRREPEDDARGRRHEQREEQDGRVQRDLGLVGNRVWRHEREDRLQSRSGQGGAERAAAHGEHQALDEKLPNDPRPACAECGAHRHLLLPLDGFRQQQIRDIGAGDQQQQTDRAEQDPQILADAAGKGLLEREQTHAPVVGKLRRLALLQVLDDRAADRLRPRASLTCGFSRPSRWTLRTPSTTSPRRSTIGR